MTRIKIKNLPTAMNSNQDMLKYFDNSYRRLKAQGRHGSCSQRRITVFKEFMETVLSGVDVPKEGKILELGCGAGTTIIWLARKGFDVHGVDISGAAITMARARVKESGLEADLRVGNALDLKDYRDDFFDLVLDGRCFHFIHGEDRKLFLASVCRVLKPSGILVVVSRCTEIALNKRSGKDSYAFHRDQWEKETSHYLGRPQDIRDEIIGAGFSILDWRVSGSEKEGCDLLVKSQKP